MRVKNRKKVSILSRVDNSESILLDVRERSGKPKTIRDFFKDTEYVYQIKFNADLKEALDVGNLTARFSIRSKIPQNKLSIFSNLKSKKTIDVTAALLKKGRMNKKKLVYGDVEGVLYRKNIDLTTLLDNAKVRNFKKLSDKELFGYKNTTVLETAGNLSKVGSDITISQTPTPYPPTSFVGKKSFKENYAKSLTLFYDPASVFFPSKDETSIDPVKKGAVTFKPLPLILHPEKINDQGIDSIMYSMRNSVSSAPVEFKIKASDYNPSDLLAINIKQVGKVRTVTVKFTLSSDEVSDKFFVVLDSIDKRGIICQTLKFEVNHAAHLEAFYAPSSVPEIFACRRSPTNPLTAVYVKTSDPHIAGFEVYIRSLSEAQPLMNSTFYKLATHMYRGLQRRMINRPAIKIPGPINPSEGRLYIFRVVPVTESGTTYGNFSTFTLNSGPFIPYHTVLSTSPASKGVSVSLSNLPDIYDGFYIERRDLTLHQRDFIPVFNNKNTEVGCGSRDKNKTIFDANTKQDHVYEYRAVLYNKGMKKIGSSTSIERQSSQLKMVDISIGNISFESSRPSGTAFTTSGRIAAVSFDIAGEIQSSNLDIVLQMIQGCRSRGILF